MNILLKLTGAIALAIGMQVPIAGSMAASSLPTHSVDLFFASDSSKLPGLVFPADTYQPPDNGGPSSSQGSGTR
jgi:hypothetical protein